MLPFRFIRRFLIAFLFCYYPTSGLASPASTIIVTEPTIQAHLHTLDKLHLTEKEFAERLPDGRLALLYANITQQINWLQELQEYYFDSAAVKTTEQHLQAIKQAIIKFYRQSARGQLYLGNQEAYQQPDVIIVLGSFIHQMERRLTVMLPLAQSLPTVPIIVSGHSRGVAPDTGFESEADYMHDFLLARGIAPHRVLVEDRAVDTVGNALFSGFLLLQQQIYSGRVLLITSDYHALRSLFLFQQILGPNYTYAVAVAPSPTTATDATAKSLATAEKELLSQAETITTLLSQLPLPGHYPPAENSRLDLCAVFYNALIHHRYYQHQANLAQQYSPLCK